jgi:hypothetical protein
MTQRNTPKDLPLHQQLFNINSFRRVLKFCFVVVMVVVVVVMVGK